MDGFHICIAAMFLASAMCEVAGKESAASGWCVLGLILWALH